jgi:hypothetical protein
MRAGVYYDVNDASYYVDPNSTSRLKNLKIEAGHGDTRLQLHYNNSTQTYRSHLTLWASEPGITYDNSGIGGNINFSGQYYGRQINDNPYGAYVRFDTNSGHVEAWTTTGSAGSAGGQGTRQWYVNNSGDAHVRGISYSDNARAYIYYDRNDTGYYIDPNSTSNTALRMRGGALFGPNPTWGEYLSVGGNGRWSGSYANVASTNGNLHLDAKNGRNIYLAWYNTSSVQVGGEIHATRFNDRNSPGYYGDFASTSYMNDVRVNILYDRNNTAYYVHNSEGDFVMRNGTVGTLKASRIELDGYQFAETSSRGVAAGNWYTIATCSSGGAFGTFHVWDGNSGRHGSMKFTAGISYGGTATITMLGKSWYSSGGIFDNVRIRKTGTYDTHYLQIYISTSGTLNYALTEAFSRANRWNLTTSGTGNPGSTTAAELNAPDSYRGLYTSAQIGAREEIYSERQFRGPVYYDSNDTGYYSDPNSTSRMNYINANHYH